MSITTGSQVARYRILEKLGAGGMGEVFLAEDVTLGRKVALKFLPEQFTQDADRVRRFEQEARAASALNHPHIITIYEIGRAEGRHFIATEFIAGQTLRQRLHERGFNLTDAVEVAVQCTSALQAAHEAGIAHRDIKPENIMLRPDGYIKILDFGLAKLTEQALPAELEGPTRSLFETQPGLVLGTVAYMSPEQARGQRVDGRTDIFSLGVVFYEMLSGRRPFNGATTSDMIAALLVIEPVRLSQHLPTIPVELERIVTRMLAKERERRYQTAQEILNDLRRVKARLELTSESTETAALPAASPNFATNLAPTSPAEDVLTAIAYTTNIAPSLHAPAAAPLNAPTGYETNVIPAAQTPMPVQPQTASVGTATQVLAPARRRRYLWPALIALALLLAAGLFAARAWQRNATIDSLAVLPFVNVNNDAEAEHLSEGIAEGVINTLSQLPELSVAARNSVIRYKGREADAKTVGQELGVAAVLLGRIRRHGDKLTINTELVNASNGRQIWGEQFNRPLADLLTVQDEIAWKISDRLKMRLTEAQKATMAKHGTQDAEAYELYLKGRYHWNQGTPAALKKADEFFEAAVAKDPSYGLAAAGCAACHAAGSDGETPQESMAKAKRVALVALKVDDTIVDAHLTLAQVNLRYDWDFATAEREFKRAIELNPQHAAAHQRYAEFLALLGRHKEATTEIWQARALDPRSAPINSDIGRLLYYAQDYDHAIEHLRKALSLDDKYAPTHSSLGLAYEQKQQTQEAILEFMRAQRLLSGEPARVMELKEAFARGGREQFWRAYLAQLQAEARDHYVPSTAIAALHTRLGEQEQALAALEKALQEKDGGVVELKVEPVFAPLRPNTKFGALLRRVGLPQ